MTPDDIENLRRELATEIAGKCDLRHVEVDRRLDSLEQQQRESAEALFGKVNRIAEEQAALSVKVDVAAAGVIRMETKLDNLAASAAAREQSTASDRARNLATALIAVAGWAVALLLFILKEVLAK